MCQYYLVTVFSVFLNIVSGLPQAAYFLTETLSFLLVNIETCVIHGPSLELAAGNTGIISQWGYEDVHGLHHKTGISQNVRTLCLTSTQTEIQMEFLP